MAEFGNAQNSLTFESLNIPVIAVGIPTCVETAVIVNDSLDLFINKLQDEGKSNAYLNEIKNNDNYEEIKNILIPENYNLIVTPKEIDELVENISVMIAEGINISLSNN